MKPGAKQTFRHEALDQFGRNFEIKAAVQWTAKGGTIDSKGLYSAGNDVNKISRERR